MVGSVASTRSRARLVRSVASKHLSKSRLFDLLALSDELVSIILSHSDAAGLAFVALQVCHQLSRIVCDDSYRTVWFGLCHRMSYKWAVKNKLLDRCLELAACRAGGWRALCHEKDAFDPRHPKLPEQAPTDWPAGRWYPLTPCEETGLFDALLEQTRGRDCQTPVSLFFLLDGSGSMTPCFRGIKRFIRNMILRLRAASHVESTVAFLQYNDYKVRNELVADQSGLNVTMQSPQLSSALENWDAIRKLGGTTSTIHAVQSAKEAFEAAPRGNTKLMLLISDGVTDDWSASIKQLVQMQAGDERAHLLVIGVAACSYYEDEFPTEVRWLEPLAELGWQDTLQLLGPGREHQLFLMSRDNERPNPHLDNIAPG